MSPSPSPSSSLSLGLSLSPAGRGAGPARSRSGIAQGAGRIDEFDPWFGPTGAKGIGEIGIVSVPAAIGNAIYNASGTRLRGLPFTPDKLLG